MPFEIKPAKREPFFPSILLSGFSGSGKTYSALLMARAFGGKTVLIDTENKRALVYAKLFSFEHIHFPPPYTPERGIEAFKLAYSKSPTTIIFDSATLEWWGKGGILREKDEMPGANEFIKWAKLTPRHEKWAGLLTLNPKCFHIVTCRAKEKSKLKKNSEGKLEVTSLGLKPIQRDDFAYDFSFGYSISHDSHKVKILKTIEEAPLPDGALTEEFAKELAAWCLMKSISKKKK